MVLKLNFGKHVGTYRKDFTVEVGVSWGHESVDDAGQQSTKQPGPLGPVHLH